MLPSKTWASYSADIKALGEHRKGVDTSDGFLKGLGLLDANEQLTSIGSSLFASLWITGNEASSARIMHDVLLENPAVLAICQALFGVPTASKSNAHSTLRNYGLSDGLTDRKLGTLLVIMDTFELIQYVHGKIHIFDPPIEEAKGSIPASVFISRETPFSNVLWLTRVLKECKGHLYWLDKHFQPAGLEAIADAADGNRIKIVRILSLKLDSNSSTRIRKKYVALQQELHAKGIGLEWRFIDSTEMRETHDRWIVGDDSAHNVPDTGTIFSGNHSEISRSDHAPRLNKVFESYWEKATSF